jgi:PAS domain S-box-containing protein
MPEKQKKRDTRCDVIQAEDDQRLFRAVFDHTFQFMGILSPEGILLDANKTALTFIDAKREDVIGQPFWETAWWTGNPEVQKKLQEAVADAAKGQLVRFDAQHISPDGKSVFVDFSLTPVLDATGKVVLLVPEGRDITERIMAQRDLAERDARNRAVLDTAPDGICTITMNGVIESANTAMHRMLGYKQGELQGFAIDRVVLKFEGDEHSDDQLKTGERKLFGVGRETTAIRKNGTVLPVEISLSLLNLGRVQVFVAVVRDITERKKSKQLQSQLAAIVESSDDAIIATDMSGIITSWNPAAEHLYGFKVAEAIGKSVNIVVPEDRNKELDSLFAALRNGESIGHFETVRMDCNKNMIDVDLTISPIRNPQGQVTGVSTIARDISVRKEAERRISEFYSMVSHELRTPLTSIRASLGLLEGGIAGKLEDEALQLVQIARSESDRLILLINDILDLRKIEAGKLELKLRQVRVSELISTVTESLRAMADEYEVKLKPVYGKDWEFTADLDRIIQVIHNLLSNAIKYSNKSDVVEILVSEPRPNFLRFSVVDRGPGIKQDQMHKLFGKFQQLDSSDSRPKGGTGLGLAISKAIVEQHAGSVGVNSRPGEGSTFWFEIPMSHSEKADKIVQQTAGKSLELTQKVKQPVILIVEDDKSTLELLLKQLQRNGFDTIATVEIRSAIKLMQTIKPDLLLLEPAVSKSDPHEIINHLKRRGMGDLPLLVYTSMDLSQAEKDSISLGPSKYLVKSISSLDDVLESVDTLLGIDRSTEKDT